MTRMNGKRALGLLFAAASALALSSCAARTAQPHIQDTLEAAQVNCGIAASCLEAAIKNRMDEAAEGRKAARSLLERLRAGAQQDAQGDMSMRAAFLLGVDAASEGALDEAVSLLNEAASRPLVRDYALFNLAVVYEKKGALESALVLHETILKDYGAGALVPLSRKRRAELLMRLGRLSEARVEFEAYASDNPRDAFAPEALYKAMYLSVELNEAPAAQEIAKRVLTAYPEDIAAQRTAKLAAQKGWAEAIVLTEDESILAADALFAALRWADAAKRYDEIRALKDGKRREQATGKLVDALMRLKRYVEAERELKTFLAQHHFPAPFLLPSTDTPMESGAGYAVEFETSALHKLIVALIRQDKRAEAEAVLERLSGEFPKSEEHAKALLLMGRAYEEDNDPAKAAEKYKKVVDGFASGPHRADALWAMGWLSFRAGELTTAEKMFSEAPGSARSVYWLARGAEKAAKFDEALKLYAGLCAAHSDSPYYCRMAKTRAYTITTGANPLSAALSEQAFEAPPVEALPSAISTDVRYETIRELLLLGLKEDASAEIAQMAKRHATFPYALKEVSALFYEAQDYYRALASYKRYAASNRGRGALVMEHSLAYPPQIIGLIKDAPAEHGVDPYLVAAVAREESEFNRVAISSAGALGMMQIMPATGRLIAKGKGVKGFDEAWLFDTRTSIRFGSWYLVGLLERFDGKLHLAVAAYNAGPTAVEKWIKKLPAPPDEFVESIPYTETRNYVKRVLGSYDAYLKTANRADTVLTSNERKRPEAGQGL